MNVTSMIDAYRGKSMRFLIIQRGGNTYAEGVFLDAQGNAITGALPAEGEVYASVFVESGMEYNPMIIEGTASGDVPVPGPASDDITLPSTTITTAPAATSILRSNPAVFNLVLTSLGVPASTVLLDNSSIVVGAALSATDAQAVIAGLSSLFKNAASLVIAMRFPSMTSPTRGVVVIGATDAINPYRGKRMSFLMIPQGRARSSSFSAAAEPEPQVGQFIDAQGSVITGALPASGDISIAAFMEAGIAYDPIAVEGVLESAEEEDNSGSTNNGNDNNPAPENNDTPAPTPAPDPVPEPEPEPTPAPTPVIGLSLKRTPQESQRAKFPVLFCLS